MMSRLLDLILQENRWLFYSMVAAVLAVGTVAALRAWRDSSNRLSAAGGTSLFYGSLIGVMGFGHLLAVTVRLALGTLARGSSLWVLYLIGFVLVIPAFWLAIVAARSPGEARRRRLVWLNAVLGGCLLVLGIHNLPLALPAALNVSYLLCPQRVLRRLLLGATVLGYCLLFVGAVWFLMSGMTFEEASGVE